MCGDHSLKLVGEKREAWSPNPQVLPVWLQICIRELRIYKEVLAKGLVITVGPRRSHLRAVDWGSP
jgi:hypothetical protein